MSSLLNVGARALLANEVALATTGHNISNANTVGYSRQTATMQQVPGQFTGSGYIGKGVEVVTVARAHNEFLTRQASLAQSVAAMDGTRANRLSALEDIFRGGASGLGGAVNDMLNAFSDVSIAPTDITSRNVLITRSAETAARFRNSQDRLDELQQGVNAQLTDAARTINATASQIGALNQQIARAQGSGQAPNDLLDQRDQLVRNLNQLVQTTSVEADDGTLNLFVGSQALVLGTSVAPMSVEVDAANTRKLTLTRGALALVVDETTLGGGSVAGLLRFQNSDLADARNGLGRMALAITTEVNAQHRLGIDLNGAAGGDFFKPIALPDAVADSGNTGNAVLGVTVSDSTALVGSAYRIEVGTGGALEVTRLSDQKRTSFAGPLPIQVDGLRIAASSGSAATGDSYVLQPYADAAGAMAMALSSPREVAAANPVQARVGAANGGSLAVAGLSVKSATANLGAPVTLTFTSAGTFDVSGTGTGNPSAQSFAPGQTISFNGWNVTLNGTPKAGDTLTIEPASAAYSSLNAGNAGALLALRDKPMFDGAAMTDGYAGLMAQVGVRAQSAQYGADVSSSIAIASETERTAVAGVNLDEEAAKLLQYQQSYQAAAKMIQLSQNLFDSVLQSMR